MSDSSERAWGLVPLLLAAPGSDRGWRRFLEALCRELSGEACALLWTRASRDRLGTLVAHGVEIGRSAVVEVEDPGRPAPPAALTPGRVFAIPPDAEEIASSRIFGRLLAPHGVPSGPGLGVVLERRPRHVTCGLLLLPTKRGWQPLPDDRALLERIAPHLVKARKLHVQLSRRADDAEALVAVFDRLALGVFLIDEEGRVSYANRSAAELLDQERGLADPEVTEEKRDPRTEALRLFLGTERLTGGGALVFSHPKDDRPLQMFSTGLTWPTSAREARARFVRAIFICDPSRTSGEPTEILRELYGLTQGESRLAILLATDHSLAEAARHLGIAHSTARTVLKTVFEKTGTNRQASLVRLLVSGPWQVRPSSRGG